MTPLLPCPSCSRHIRESESQCPFCAASLSSNQKWAAALAVSVALAIAGCARTEPEVPTIKPVTEEKTPESAPATQGAVVAPSTQSVAPTTIPERTDAPAYGLAPRPRPVNKYGAPRPPEKDLK